VTVSLCCAAEHAAAASVKLLLVKRSFNALTVRTAVFIEENQQTHNNPITQLLHYSVNAL
jgi:hypothetical protein